MCNLWETFIRRDDYSLGNLSLDLCSHRLHGFSQIFCCLGNSCLQMSGCVVRRNKSVFICGIRGRAFIRDYSLGNISLDLCSHRLHGFSQIFCCLGNSCLQMSGCVVRRNKSVFICGIRGRIKLIIRGSAICGRHDLSSVGLISV